MDDYADSIEPMEIDKKRKRTEEIMYKEISALRELVGKLAWLAHNMRPDLCYGAVYLQKNWLFTGWEMQATRQEKGRVRPLEASL